MMQLTLTDWDFEDELARLTRRLRSPWRLFLHRLRLVLEEAVRIKRMAKMEAERTA